MTIMDIYHWIILKMRCRFVSIPSFSKIDEYNKELLYLCETDLIDSLDLLICNECGCIPLDIDDSKLLYQVIASCYEKRSFIITTNLGFSKRNGIFYHGKLTSAIVDKMVHHSHFLVLDVPSYKLENSLMKTNLIHKWYLGY